MTRRSRMYPRKPCSSTAGIFSQESPERAVPHMKPDIEHCLAQPHRPDRVDRVFAHFSLSTPEEAGIRTADLDAIQRSAESCLEQFRLEVPAAQYNSHLAVRRLGREKQSRSAGSADMTRAMKQAARQLAHTLCA